MVKVTENESLYPTCPTLGSSALDMFDVRDPLNGAWRLIDPHCFCEAMYELWCRII